MFQTTILLITSSLLILVHGETKYWLPKLDSIDEWYTHPVKCPKTSLKFTEDSLEFFDGNSHEKEIIFASSGFYYFQDKGQLIIGDTTNVNTEECANAFGDEVTVHSVKSQSWMAYNNWYSESNTNPAKPDVEKIPCDSDEVIFNATSVTRVDMDSLFVLQLKRVSIGDKWLQPEEFGAFCTTVLGQKMFENCANVNFEPPKASASNSPVSSCHLMWDYYESAVCSNAPKCSPAKCIDPIRPHGFCCDICGASLRVVIPPKQNLVLTDLNTMLSRKLSSQPNIAFYSSIYDQDGKILQVNIVDRNGDEKNTQKALQIVGDVLKKRFGEFILIGHCLFIFNSLSNANFQII